jgi:membrane fusion protein (multidrug efflux system)
LTLSTSPGTTQNAARRGMGAVGWIILVAVLFTAGFGGYRVWSYLQTFEETDDAQIDGDIYPVTSRVNGTVRAVHFSDNDAIKAGQVLIELDPADFNVAVKEAAASLAESESQVAAARPNIPIVGVSTETNVSAFEAAIATARAQLAAAQRDHESAVAQIRQAEADRTRADSDLSRYKQLIAKDEISRQQFDQADAAAKAAVALVDARKAAAEAAARNIEAAQARLREAETRAAEATRNRPQQMALQAALLKTRQAAAATELTKLEEARLNSTYIQITAPVDGIAGRKSVAPGQQVAPGQMLLADVAVGNLWVTANFKETQLRRMKPGQRATLRVDAFDREYEGVVDSFAGASGLYLGE